MSKRYDDRYGPSRDHAAWCDCEPCDCGADETRLRSRDVVAEWSPYPPPPDGAALPPGAS